MRLEPEAVWREAIKRGNDDMKTITRRREIYTRNPEPQATAADAVAWLDNHWEPRQKYAVRAFLQTPYPQAGTKLKRSYHPAGEVEGITKDKRLDGTAGFEIGDPSEIPAAARLAKWFFGGQAREFGVITGPRRGKAWMPEDSGVLIQDARLVFRFQA